MTIGKMDRRIQILRAIEHDDGFGVTTRWEPIGAPIWAQRRDVSDIERWRAVEMQAELSARFVIRSSAFARNIRPTDRLVCEGAEFDIAGIRQLDRRAFLEINASARAE